MISDNRSEIARLLWYEGLTHDEQLYEVQEDLTLCYIVNLFPYSSSTEVKLLCETFMEFKQL